MTDTRKSIVKSVFRLPIIGPWIKHANSYVWQGKGDYTWRLAPLSKWARSIGSDIVSAAIFSLSLELTICYFQLNSIDYSSLIQEFFPSFIGFAIGVYALTFILPSTVTKESLNERRKKNEALPSNLGYPIISIIFMLFASVILTIFPQTRLVTSIQGFLLVYGFMLMIEITSLVTTIGRAQVSQRLSSNTDDATRDQTPKKDPR